ncbi:hypothetical protein [Ancylobacter oerskovii]|uniref:Uncharacterized protein n=1 Tax=Ancylobacter oerskovii TaxID=459519 RepID=A0ABW4YVS0_9HYPH|nr:hypothetical protein [Ancylobacter oerskovii]
MEIMFGIGALVILVAIAYGMHQSRKARGGKELPEEKVDRKSPL